MYTYIYNIYIFLYLYNDSGVCVCVFFFRVFSNIGYYKILNRILKNSKSFTFLFEKSYYSLRNVKTNSLFDQIKRVRLIKNDDIDFFSYSFFLFSHPSLSPK